MQNSYTKIIVNPPQVAKGEKRSVSISGKPKDMSKSTKLIY